MSQSYKYSNNREYRNIFRNAIGMNNVPIPPYLEDEDEETLDEMNYDDAMVEQFMTKIYENTKHHFAFTELYKKAAALMISTDYGVGLAILLSYDYFCDFYPLYVFFEKDPNNICHIEKNIHYQTLSKKLQ